MKFTFLFPVFATSLISLSLNAQETKPVKQKKFQIASFSGYFSSAYERLPASSIDDFKGLAPHSELLNEDFSSYELRSYQLEIPAKMYAGYISFEFSNKEGNTFRKNSCLNLGVNYSEDLNLDKYYSKTSYFDTNPNDQDTMYTDAYQMTNRSKKLYLDLSLRYKIRPDKRFSFYTGIGLSTGALYDNNTRVSNIRNSYYYGNFQDPLNYNSTSSRNYGYKNKMGLAVVTYVPIGIDFRLGKKDSFLRMIHLFFETRPSAKVVFQPEVKPKLNALINYGFGVKFSRE